MKKERPTSSSPRMCQDKVLIGDTDYGPCPYPTVTSRVSRCVWHRLLRTDIPGQALAARHRLAAAPQPHRARVPADQWPPGERWCAGCQSFVPAFYARGSQCRACARAADGRARRKTLYGVDEAEWAQVLRVQDGTCAICGHRPREYALALEHNHGTKRLRGACCESCNHKILGGAHDSPFLLASALAYLLRPPADGRWRPGVVTGPLIIRAAEEALALLDETDPLPSPPQPDPANPDDLANPDDQPDPGEDRSEPGTP